MSELDEASDEYERLEKTSSMLLWNSRYALKTVRSTLGALSSTNEDVMEQHFDGAISTYLLDRMIDLAKTRKRHVSWKEWLSDIATDEELMNVLQWHNNDIERQATSERVELAFEIHKHLFVTRANELYADGLLAEPSKKADITSLVVGDIFDTVMKERLGYFHTGATEVVVAQGRGVEHEHRIEALINDFPRILTHEFVHALLCTSLEAIDSPIAARWCNEAMTEELSREIRKKFGSTDAEDGTYLPERQLLAQIINASPNKPASWLLATHAYTGTLQDRTIFVSHIDALWKTSDVFEKINTAIFTEEKRIMTAGQSKDRLVEIEAVTNVLEKLRTNPEGLLHSEVEGIIERLEKAAHE